MRAAIVHLVGDLIQSLGVIVAAVIIYIKPQWTIADPICTFIFSILVMITTVPVFTECLNFLMESAPQNINTVDLYNAISELECVSEIHDFHLWALSNDKPIFTAHIICSSNSNDPQRQDDYRHNTMEIIT